MYTILATETTANLTETLKPIMDSITGAVSAGDIVSVVGVALGFGLTFFLAWFGIRKVSNMALGAIKSGKVRA